MPQFVPITLGAPQHVEIDIDGFRVTEAHFTPHLHLSPHEHERAAIAVMLDGSFDVRMRGRVFDCPPMTVITEPAGERHANRIERAGAHVVVVQPDHTRRELLRPFTELTERPHCFRKSPVFGLARRVTRELRFPDAVTPLAVEGLVFEMLALLSRALDGPRVRAVPPWMARVEDLLQARFRQPLRVANIAAEVDVHPAHLMRAFRLRHGTSLGAEVRRLRIEWAAQELVRKRTPIAAIAHAAGFADQSHFTRLFHRHMSATPARYRAEHATPSAGIVRRT
jgi:AraC family transcriptional regulator